MAGFSGSEGEAPAPNINLAEGGSLRSRFFGKNRPPPTQRAAISRKRGSRRSTYAIEPGQAVPAIPALIKSPRARRIPEDKLVNQFKNIIFDTINLSISIS